MIELKSLTKYYGKALGIRDVDLKIKKGEIFGLIGPNGAGKSTMIKCIMHMLNITSGEIYINGKLLINGEETYKSNIGYLPSEIHLYGDLTVKQNLDYSASFYEKDLSKRTNELVKLLKIDLNKKIEDLSLGNLKKVGIVIALMHNPEILILDEPTSGLDPLMQEVFFEILEKEKKKGTTILFSTHILSEVKKICDRIGFIKDGIVIKIDTTSNLIKDNVHVVSLYSKEKIFIEKSNILKKDKNYIKFVYTDNINKLLMDLKKIKIDNIYISEPELEDIFMNYYK